MKSLGVGLGAFGFHDAWVERDASGEPRLVVEGTASKLADAAGVTRFHLSITHTDTLAIAFVAGATLFSLTTQAWALGSAASTLSARLGISPAVLLLGLLPHALPELFALFLPLAAWTIASRRKAWNELLAATFVTVAIAVPIILAAAVVETWLSPGVLRALAG